MEIASRISTVTLAVCLSVGAAVYPQTPSDSSSSHQGLLSPGQAETGELDPGRSHAWTLGLEADQYVEVEVRQKGVDLAVRVSDPENRPPIEYAGVSDPTGTVQAKWVADVAGDWKLLIAASDAAGSAGYEVEWTIQRPATENDRRLLEADRLHEEGRKARQDGDYGKAQAGLREALAIRETVLGQEHTVVAKSLDSLALLYRDQGRYEEAEPLFERSLNILEKALGAEDLEVAHAVNNLAGLYWYQGRYQDAEPLFQRSLAIRQKALGPEHPEVAASLNNLAALHWYQGKYEQAEPLFRRSLEIWEKALGAEHLDVAGSLNNLALLYSEQGKYEQAEPLFRRSLDIREKVLGMERPEVAQSLNNLAILYRDQGKYEQAEPLFDRSVAIRERVLGADHPHLADSLSNLALLYRDQGKYEQAEPLFRRSLEISEQALGPEHRSVAASLHYLADFYRDQGKYEEAEPLFQRSLEILENTLGPEHPDVATSLNNLALLFSEQDKYEEAEQIFLRSLAVREKVLGREHRAVAASLAFLAELYRKQRQYEQAEPLYRRSLDILEKTLGANHPDVAESLRSYAELLVAREELSKALRLVDRAIAILDSTAAYPESRIEAYELRSQIRKRRGDAPAAISDLAEALRSLEELRPHLGGGEETRARQLERYREYYNRMVAWQVEAGDLGAALSHADRGRARSLLDQLKAGRIDLRSGIPPDIRAELEKRESEIKARLAEYQQRITLLRDRSGLDESERLSRIQALEATLKQTQIDYQRVYDEIKNASPLWRDLITAGGQPVSLTAIQRQLIPQDGLLLYYLVGEEQSFLFTVPAAGSPPQAHSLAIDQAMAARYRLPAGNLTNSRLQQILTGRPEAAAESDTLRSLGAFPHLSHSLWQILVPAEIQPVLMEAAEVVIIPDGALHLLTFESLVVKPPSDAGDKIRYWLDEGPMVRYAASAATLYNLERRPDVRLLPHVTQTTVLSLSDPIYSPSEMTRAETAQTLRQTAADRPAGEETAVTRNAYERLGGALRRLPGTVRETKAIRAAFQVDRSEDPVMVLQEMQAREKELRANLGEKRYLHLATHGLVAQAGRALFSALALTPPAGAVATSDDDGFLQLYEIYDLKIPECELAVLSACDTNVGERFNGEGVFGLSRGFLAAGARRVIASQWAVDDESTAVLMGRLFQRIAEQERRGRRVDYAEALRDAKLAVRGEPRWADPYFWAPFILIGKR